MSKNGEIWFTIDKSQPRSTLSTNNLGAFYRFVNKRITNRSNIGVLIDDCGKAITENIQKAKVFNSYFASVGSIDNGHTPVCQDVQLNTILEDINFSQSDVIRAISKLKSRSSSGPDNIPPDFYKHLKHCLSGPLALIFNQLFSVAEVPREWKNAYIVPLYKKVLPVKFKTTDLFLLHALLVK